MNSPTAPETVCILRLSALGDVTHVVPVVHALQAQWPGIQITWIIGKLEHKLVGALPDVEFIPYDKSGGWRAYRELRRRLGGRRFDALLLMQLSARANMISTAVKARRRIGYDAGRSREGHSLFINERIAPATLPHVLDTFMQFPRALGASIEERDWTLPSSDADRAWAAQAVPDDKPFAIFSPASSHVLRNWSVAGYAALADHLAAEHGLRIVLCGGPSALEKQLAQDIAAAMQAPALDLVGRDTLPQYLALLRRARLLVTPDSGPAHMGAVTGTPVLGLYAATDPQRSGPYLWREHCVNAYPEAARTFIGKPATELRWGQKIEVAGVMDLITPDAACDAADKLLATLD